MLRLGFGLVFGLFAMSFGIVLEGGHPELYFRLSSAIVVIAGALAPLLMSFPIPVWQKSFGIALGFTPAGKNGTTEAEHFFRTLGRNFLLAGFAGFLFSVMHVFQTWDTSLNAAGFAVSLIAPAQAVLLKLFIADACRHRVARATESKRETLRRAA
jgi:hypothetical protein